MRFVDQFTMKYKTTFYFLVFSFSIFSAGCGPVDLDKLLNSEPKAKNYNLTKEFKLVERYDCDNVLVSNKVETITLPQQAIRINPKSFDNLFSSYFKNETNESSPATVEGKVKFTLDIENADSKNMKVENGINKINYEFRYCGIPELDSSGKKTGKCLSTPVVRESGSIFVNIVYQEVHSDGVLTFKPSPENCN